MFLTRINKSIAKVTMKPGRIIGSVLHFFIISFITSPIIYTVGALVTFGYAILSGLNIHSEQAISAFIQSPAGTKTLMQGVTLPGTISFLVSILATVQAASSYEIKSDMGSSRFADNDELRPILQKTSNPQGLIFGSTSSGLLVKSPNTSGHVMTIGGSGEGKTYTHVIPSLLSWPGSALVVDIKGELYETTAKYRQTLGEVIRFNPTENNSVKYNPIFFCDTVHAAQDLARTLIPEPVRGEPFWAQSAQAILAAAAFEGSKSLLSLGEVAERCILTPIQDLIKELSESHYRETKLLAGGYLDTPDKTLGGIASTLRTSLTTLASDMDIVNSTSQSTFKPSSLEDTTTIYLTIPESRIEQLKPLWTIIISQFIRFFENRQEGNPLPILFMLDEFPRMGRITGIDGALSTLRSRNVHIDIILQSLSQLDDKYGKDVRKVIMDLCPFKLVLSASEPETQKVLSDLAGKKTGVSRSVSTMSIHQHFSSVSVPLIYPEEFARLKDEAILFAPKQMPIKLKRIDWKKDKVLSKRA